MYSHTDSDRRWSPESVSLGSSYHQQYAEYEIKKGYFTNCILPLLRAGRLRYRWIDVVRVNSKPTTDNRQRKIEINGVLWCQRPRPTLSRTTRGINTSTSRSDQVSLQVQTYRPAESESILDVLVRTQYLVSIARSQLFAVVNGSRYTSKYLAKVYTVRYIKRPC